MNPKLEKGILSIDFGALIDGMSEESLLELADTVSLTDAVIKNVSDQIVNGWTDLRSHAAKSQGDPCPSTALGKAIRAVAVGSSDVAKEYIEALERSMIHDRIHHEAVSAWGWSMWHRLSKETNVPCGRFPPPDPPQFDVSGAGEYKVVKA